MKLAAVGSNCVDFYKNIENGKAYPGGSPVNMAVYTVRLGGEASYTGPVGDDVYGKIMQEAIAAKGVDTSHLYVKPGKTAVSQVELLEGERVFGDYEEGVLEDYTLSEEDMDFIQTHDMVVCDLWGKVEGQFRALKARGIPTAFDCATRPEDEASRIAMPYTDYLFFSSDDGDTPALRDQMKGYHSRGPKLVIALLGEHAVCATTEASSINSASFPVNTLWTAWARATAISPASCTALWRGCPSMRPCRRERPTPPRR